MNAAAASAMPDREEPSRAALYVAHDEPGPKVKKAITMPEQLAAEIDTHVGRGEFSAFMARAAQHWLALMKTGEIVDEYERQHGPISDERLEQARRRWHDA
ncbi:hypothetical protein ITP53_17925 [Nonomuraea sp. K274]|uniref:CopG family transcriptional regulator n=1 Tax=Nonomuraea cypriaca TaxID=1187855 RepID=A0A931EXA7_9ACTN|nr:hypothetical protein [Nonomuraea cypriaca]MBF8187579.1 hypothetical protein [Nonomuraea cypriaca]